MNEENNCGQRESTDTVEGPNQRVVRWEIMDALKHVTVRMVPGSYDIYAEMILSSGDVVIRALIVAENTRWK